MKYHREHIDTLTRGAAKALLAELDIEALPTHSQALELNSEATGRYIMVLARDKNYDILYEHYNFGGR